jgi:hypothetical protein
MWVVHTYGMDMQQARKRTRTVIIVDARVCQTSTTTKTLMTTMSAYDNTADEDLFKNHHPNLITIVLIITNLLA